jgi:hypothetical protein
MHHDDLGREAARQFLGIVEGVIRVVGEVGRGENLGECSHEPNDTPGAASGQVNPTVVQMFIR